MVYESKYPRMIPLCYYCGDFWRGDSEACPINHTKDLEEYADEIREITARESKDGAWKEVGDEGD